MIQDFVEYIVEYHHYSPDYISAAAAAANAGTCLEDGDAEDRSHNVFDNLVDAVSEVRFVSYELHLYISFLHTGTC